MLFHVGAIIHGCYHNTSASGAKLARAWTLPVSYPCVCSIYSLPGVRLVYRVLDSLPRARLVYRALLRFSLHLDHCVFRKPLPSPPYYVHALCIAWRPGPFPHARRSGWAGEGPGTALFTPVGSHLRVPYNT